MERLLNLGFEEEGYWFLNDRVQIDFNLQSPLQENSLFLFKSLDRVSYVGVAPAGLGYFMNSFKNPITNNHESSRIHDHLLQDLADGVTVEIFALRDPGVLNFVGFTLNLSIALMTDIIDQYQPFWNVMENRATRQVNEFRTQPNGNLMDPEHLANILREADERDCLTFTIPIMEEYFYKGFIILPTQYRNSFGDDMSSIDVLFEGFIHEGHIYRNSWDGLTRLMVGRELSSWLADTNTEGELLTIRKLSSRLVEIF